MTGIKRPGTSTSTGGKTHKQHKNDNAKLPSKRPPKKKGGLALKR